MPAVAVIPARFAAVRFPGKPLADRTGKPMIQHVVEQARKAQRVSRVIVATDDERIAAAVRKFGGEVAMTRADHQSGTDRIAEVAGGLTEDIILNVQGDEPEMSPGNIDRLVVLMESDAAVRIGTVACKFPADRPATGAGSPCDPNCVKVVLDAAGRALYFSRATIPFPRDAQGRPDDVTQWLLHLGIYGFRRETLLELSRLSPVVLEVTERLEQLRRLHAGHRVSVAVGDAPSAGIDTPEDYEAFVTRWNSRVI